MGVDLCIVLNGKKVADLYRAYHYKLIDNWENELHKKIINIALTIAHNPQDFAELLNMWKRFQSDIELIIDESHRKGQIDLLEQLREQGFETMTDYEWEEQQKIKNMPDYFEPKV